MKMFEAMKIPNDIVENEGNRNSDDLPMLNEQPLGQGRVRRQSMESNFLRLAQLLPLAEVLLQELDHLLFTGQLISDWQRGSAQFILKQNIFNILAYQSSANAKISLIYQFSSPWFTFHETYNL